MSSLILRVAYWKSAYSPVAARITLFDIYSYLQTSVYSENEKVCTEESPIREKRVGRNNDSLFAFKRYDRSADYDGARDVPDRSVLSSVLRLHSNIF